MPKSLLGRQWSTMLYFLLWILMQSHVFYLILDNVTICSICSSPYLLFQENGHDEIVIKAMGRAINKTVMVVELIKRRIGGLHQITSTESIDITDTWEPLEEGLLPLETTRHVSMIAITLSKKALDTLSPGYQPPIPAEEVRPAFDYEHEESFPTNRGRGRGGGRRGRGRGILFLMSSMSTKLPDYNTHGYYQYLLPL
jgi:DNA-binding protein Alba